MPPRTQTPVERVRQLLAQGLSQTVIAKRLGLAKSVVYRVRKEAARGHVH
jgi:DNA invertase Pin-like site-specific DNA recombinase